MPFCRECGFEVDASMKFCPNCASPQQIDTVKEPIVTDPLFTELYELSKKTSLKMDYNKTLETQMEMKSISEKNGDELGALWARVMLCRTSITFEGDTLDLEGGEQVALEAITLAKEHSNYRMEGDAMQLMADISNKCLAWDTAIEWVNEQFRIWEHLGDSDEIIASHLSLCHIHTKMGSFENAKLHLEKSQELIMQGTDYSLLTPYCFVGEMGILLRFSSGMSPEERDKTNQQIAILADKCISFFNENGVIHSGTENFIEALRVEYQTVKRLKSGRWKSRNAKTGKWFKMTTATEETAQRKADSSGLPKNKANSGVNLGKIAGGAFTALRVMDGLANASRRGSLSGALDAVTGSIVPPAAKTPSTYRCANGHIQQFSSPKAGIKCSICDGPLYPV